MTRERPLTNNWQQFQLYKMHFVLENETIIKKMYAAVNMLQSVFCSCISAGEISIWGKFLVGEWSTSCNLGFWLLSCQSGKMRPVQQRHLSVRFSQLVTIHFWQVIIFGSRLLVCCLHARYIIMYGSGFFFDALSLKFLLIARNLSSVWHRGNLTYIVLEKNVC